MIFVILSLCRRQNKCIFCNLSFPVTLTKNWKLDPQWFIILYAFWYLLLVYYYFFGNTLKPRELHLDISSIKLSFISSFTRLLVNVSIRWPYEDLFWLAVFYYNIFNKSNSNGLAENKSEYFEKRDQKKKTGLR